MININRSFNSKFIFYFVLMLMVGVNKYWNKLIIHCLKSVKNQLLLSKNEKTIDLFAEDIRIALNKFQELFGNVDIEDILDIIFSDFCIGK